MLPHTGGGIVLLMEVETVYVYVFYVTSENAMGV